MTSISTRKRIKSLDFLWLLLMGMTVAAALVGESAEPSLAVTLFVAAVVAVKGRIVVERFMELHNANRHLRRLMNAYFYFFPALIVLVYLYPQKLAELTTL